MYSTVQSICLILGMALGGFVLGAAGCGGRGGSMVTQAPISVSLVITTVTVSPNGTPVIVPININSPSETALVAVSGLPGGLKVTYAASDTNPSGTLTFTAGASATVGTYMPIVTVNSAGQTASTKFTLVVMGTKAG